MVCLCQRRHCLYYRCFFWHSSYHTHHRLLGLADGEMEKQTFCGESSTTGDATFTMCEKLYRVHFVGHTANKLFAMCPKYSPQQTGCLPCSKCLAHGKQMDTQHSPIFAVCRAIKHTVNIYTRQKSLLCRVFLLSTRQI